MIGKLDMNNDGTKIVFIECKTPMGENGDIIEFNINTGKSRVLVKADEKNYVNLDPIYINNNEITYLSIQRDQALETAQRYQLNCENLNKKLIDIDYKGEKLFRDFNRIYK